jgi:hypothetical protein
MIKNLILFALSTCLTLAQQCELFQENNASDFFEPVQEAITKLTGQDFYNDEKSEEVLKQQFISFTNENGHICPSGAFH